MLGRRHNSRSEAGQSLIETAIAIPLLLIIAFNAINFGYAFFVALNTTAAPRTGVEYAIQGFQTPAQVDLATATQVSTLTYGDMTGVLPNSGTTPQNVCTKRLGVVVVSGNPVANCQAFNDSGSSFPTTAPPDPEVAAASAPKPPFVLSRVDVRYTPQQLIPGGIFNLLPTLTFHRQVSMRALD